MWLKIAQTIFSVVVLFWIMSLLNYDDDLKELISRGSRSFITYVTGIFTGSSTKKSH